MVVADPELRLRLPGGETDEETVVTDTEPYFVAPKLGDC